ncbi:toprim domain-containing protein [Umezawaea sp. NPDC059074]|uniref:toprim domain-containing protein n=1 Tax=Umezawaea sp. NPDC059074 TaxID=3346716 RepID=UPI0036A2F520
MEGDSALGCFTGETLVAMAYGRPKSFTELVADWAFGITHYGYASTETGKVVVVPLLEPRLTRYLAPLVRVTLDNGEVLRCTPDHLFRLRDGSYRRADDLVVGQSLMPLYRGKSVVDGQVPVWMNDREVWALPRPEAEHSLSGTLDLPGDGRAPVNHQVGAVELIEDVADVYDLTVDVHHNFALESGVFVHNSARMARVSEYQALLPLRGKILNVQKASLGDTLRNAEIASIVQVLGAGTGRTFDLAAMRYGRVILMADADVDGSHIRTLLITLFAKYMRPVIEDGRLYAAMPPLHKVVTKGRNPETRFTFTQREMEQTVARFEKAGKQIVTPVPRFKGLGEMDADELWETTMNPATRSVRRITIDDAEAAESALELLMGEKVEPRRVWLVESSSRVDQSAIDL